MDRASVTCRTESRGIIYRIEVSGGKREKGTEKNLMIHIYNVSKFDQNINSQIQSAQRTPSKINVKID